MFIDVSKSVVEGYEACLRHGEDAVCPYAEGTEYHAGWLIGWHMGVVSREHQETMH